MIALQFLDAYDMTAEEAINCLKAGYTRPADAMADGFLSWRPRLERGRCKGQVHRYD
jgi:hypothetical protein